MTRHKIKPKINAERLGREFDELAEIGATVDGGVSRLALSNEDLEARTWLAMRFEEAGLLVQDDDAGNLSGIWRCPDDNAKTLMIGSHLDTVPNGGRYDGSIGVLAGLECVRSLREVGVTLPFHVEVMDFTDEEGCWQSLFGSRALTGALSENYTRSFSGDLSSFRAALFRAGIRPADVYKARRNPESLFGYLELHIEQSHVLDDAGVDLGVVTAIVGRSTYHVTFFGEAGHSGTTRASSRRDALLGAAAFITAAHHMAHDNFPQGALNCGNVTVEPGAFNIIPSKACVTVECRHSDRDTLAAMEEALTELAMQTADAYHLEVLPKRIGHMPAATMAGQMVLAIEQACDNIGASRLRLQGLSGHDAQTMSSFTPSGMIFLPSVGGISHNPKEFTHWPHILKGVDVLLETILLLAERAESG